MYFTKNALESESGAKQRAQCTGRNSAEPSDDRTIEMMDKKQEENVCGTKEGLHHVYTGRRAATATAKVCVHRSSNIGLLCFTEPIVALCYVCVGRSYQNRGVFVLVISNINIGFQKSLTPPLIFLHINHSDILLNHDCMDERLLWMNYEILLLWSI